MYVRLVSTLVLLTAIGCSQTKPPPPNLPTVHKVTGQVIDKKTSQPITTGAVQFESLATAAQVAIADVQPDGSFSLNTFVDGHKLEGAVPGPQRVTFMPRTTEDQSAAVPVTLPQTFEVKESGNDFKIAIP